MAEFSEIHHESMEWDGASLTPSQLVERQRQFVSTKEVVCPQIITGNTIDDLAAVIAGRKPAAGVVPRAIEDYRWGGDILKLAKDQGYKQEDVEGWNGEALMIIGKAENVDIISSTMKKYIQSGLRPDENYHRVLGEQLGYPSEAIDDFINWAHLCD
jgi:hypothetical protein